MLKERIGEFTFQEISQGEALRETLRLGRERFERILPLLPLSQYSELVFTGCGSSYHIAQCAAYGWKALVGHRCLALPSSELLHFSDFHLNKDSRPLVFAISRSGGTDETVLSVNWLRSRYGARAVGITSALKTEVGQCVDREIPFLECEERSVVATRSLTSMLLGLLLLADFSSGERNLGQLMQLPGLLARSLKLSEATVRPLAEDESLHRFVFLGSGPFSALAAESALKMTEMALTTSHAYHTLEFRHGPKVLLSPHTLVIAFVSAAEQAYVKMLLEEIEEADARVLVISDHPIESDMQQLNFRSDLKEIFQPVLFAHTTQQLAFWRASARGLDPDSPPHLVRTVKLSR